MKNKQHSESRKTYLVNVLAFLCLLGAVWGAYIVFVAVNTPPQPEVVADRAMTARIPGKGTFYMEPDLLVYCGQVPAPMDWNLLNEDGTIDSDQVLAFTTDLGEWKECATEYAAVIRAYALSTDMLRDVVVESARNFFLEFVEPEPEMLGEDFSQGENGDHAGTFIQGRPCEECHGDKYKQE